MIQNQKYVFQQFAATSVIDNRGHQAEHFSVEEKEYHNREDKAFRKNDKETQNRHSRFFHSRFSR